MLDPEKPLTIDALANELHFRERIVSAGEPRYSRGLIDDSAVIVRLLHAVLGFLSVVQPGPPAQEFVLLVAANRHLTQCCIEAYECGSGAAEIARLESQIRKQHEINHTYYGGCKCELCVGLSPASPP